MRGSVGLHGRLKMGPFDGNIGMELGYIGETPIGQADLGNPEGSLAKPDPVETIRRASYRTEGG